MEDLELSEKSEPYAVHRAAIIKQNLIRNYLIKLFEVSQDQRFQSGQNLSSTYLRPYAQRHLFDLDRVYLPKNVPFELYCLYRHFYLQEFEGLKQEEFFPNHMFNFEREFMF